MTPAIAKARQIVALETIAANQKLILEGQQQLAAKFDLIANLAPAAPGAGTAPTKPSKDK